MTELVSLRGKLEFGMGNPRVPQLLYETLDCTSSFQHTTLHTYVYMYMYMEVQKVYLLQRSQSLGNPTQCLLRHSQAYKKCKRQSHRDT